VPKGSAAQQAADCSTIRHIEMGFTDWVKEDTETHSDYEIFISFPKPDKDRNNVSYCTLADIR